MALKNRKKQHDQSKSRKRENRHSYYKLWRRGRNRSRLGVTKKMSHVTAPSDLAFNANPEGVIQFINAIERMYNIGHQVYIDISLVETIDYGAILSLLAMMIKFQGAGIKFNGNFPKAIQANVMLKNSGFFKYLYTPLKYEEEYKLNNGGKNEIITHAKKVVDPVLADTVIESASQTIWGEPRRCKGAYSNLIELMQNTHNHAVYGSHGQKHWWLYVKHDEINHRVSFAFLDFGIGIFESLKEKPYNSPWRRIYEKFKESRYFSNNAELLKLVMSGEFHKAVSVTGHEYRGKGLPAVASSEKRNQISALRIISNDVFATPNLDEYRLLTKCFNGTYLYWELGESNDSIIKQDS